MEIPFIGAGNEDSCLAHACVCMCVCLFFLSAISYSHISISHTLNAVCKPSKELTVPLTVRDGRQKKKTHTHTHACVRHESSFPVLIPRLYAHNKGNFHGTYPTTARLLVNTSHQGLQLDAQLVRMCVES